MDRLQGRNTAPQWPPDGIGHHGDNISPGSVVYGTQNIQATGMLQYAQSITNAPIGNEEDDNRECLRALFVTDPRDDLAAIRRARGERIPGTCEWVLRRAEYTAWLDGNGTQLLRLMGAPGIGKTMVSSFLVDELERRVKQSPGTAFFAYYFCDSKDDKRNGAKSIVRGLLWQLLTRQSNLFNCISKEYSVRGRPLLDDLDALWRIFLEMLKQCEGEVIFLLDALDECKRASRRDLLTLLNRLSLLGESNGKMKANIKFLITCRPEPDIQEFNIGKILRIGSGEIHDDLTEFVRVKVMELSLAKKYPPKLKKDVESALGLKAGGTFLWASLILTDLYKVDFNSKVSMKLSDLPSSLNEVYDRILNQVQPHCEEEARFVLRCVVVARRPLTVDELAMAYAFGAKGWNEKEIPDRYSLDLWSDIFKACGPLIYIDDESKTINLIHESVKDYLLSEPPPVSLTSFRTFSIGLAVLLFLCSSRLFWIPALCIFAIFHLAATQPDSLPEPLYKNCTIIATNLRSELRRFLGLPVRFSEFRVVSDVANILLFRVCWRYLSMEEFEYGNRIIQLDQYRNLVSKRLLKHCLDGHCFLSYASIELHSHALAASPAAFIRCITEMDDLNKMPTLRDALLLRMAREGREDVLRIMLAKGADISAKDEAGRTVLLYAVEGGREDVVRLLLENSADIAAHDGLGRTAVHYAVDSGQEAVALLLLDWGASVSCMDWEGQTLLYYAAKRGLDKLSKQLLQKGTNAAEKDSMQKSALHWAATNGHEAVAKLLLERGDVEVNSKDKLGRTPLLWAAGEGHEAVVRLLLKRGGVEVNSKDKLGRTSLLWAAERGHEAVVKLLLDCEDVETDSKDPQNSRTPLSWAAGEGHEAVVKLLLKRGDVEADSKDTQYGQTPLSWAAENGHDAVVKLLLGREDVEVDSKDKFGRTPLSWAAENGREAVAKLLLQREDVEVDSKDPQNSRTPLSWAAEYGRVAVAKLLLEREDVEVDSKDKIGRTPLGWALEKGHEAVVQLLSEKGATINA